MDAPRPHRPDEPGLVRYLVFSGSLREGSLNTRLARLAAGAVLTQGGQVDHASMGDFDAPSYNGDVQTAHGLPAGALEF